MTTHATAGRFRKRPVEVEAMRLDNDPAASAQVYRWVETNTTGSFEPTAVLEGRAPCPASGVSIDPANGNLLIATLEGLMRAAPGDWIIRGIHGEFYPCKPDIFDDTYEPIEEQQ